MLGARPDVQSSWDPHLARKAMSDKAASRNFRSAALLKNFGDQLLSMVLSTEEV